MNCFEFRKLAMSDPYSQDKVFVEHHNNCPDCNKYLQGILSFDKQLVQAASATRAPDELKSRLKLNQVMLQQQQVHQRFRAWSYAAGVVLAITAGILGVQSYQANQRFNELYGQVAAHIEYESGAFTTVQATAQARMKSHLASYAGVNVPELPGLRYSQLCPLGTKKTWHGVMDTVDGMVIVIYFKGDKMPNMDRVKDSDFVKVEKTHQGSMLYIGKSQASVDAAAKQVNKSLATLI